MPINYSYLNGRPNATYRDEVINNPGLLTQRQQSEAYRLARQANPNFGYGGTTQPEQQLLEPSRALAEPSSGLLGSSPQIPGLDAAFGPDWGGNDQGVRGNPTQGGQLQSLFGYNPSAATLAAAAGSLGGIPASGLLANALFGDQRSITNSAINTGIGFGISKLGRAAPVVGALAGPAMKAMSGKTLTAEDILMTLAQLHPATRTLTALWSGGKALAGLFGKSQNERDEDALAEFDFGTNLGVAGMGYPQASTAALEAFNMPTTENTFDIRDPSTFNESSLSNIFDMADPLGEASVSPSFDMPDPLGDGVSYPGFDMPDPLGDGLGLGSGTGPDPSNGLGLD